jgi:hypothetical protein
MPLQRPGSASGAAEPRSGSRLASGLCVAAVPPRAANLTALARDAARWSGRDEGRGALTMGFLMHEVLRVWR